VTHASNAVGTPFSFKLTLQLKKNGENLGDSADTAEITTGTAVVVNLIEISIPETNFAKGDTFGIAVTVTETANNGYLAWGHDPMNRDGDYISPSSDDPESTTRFIVRVPFKIDIS
jgi:hypothetical protein